jgi:RhoGAP domain
VGLEGLFRISGSKVEIDTLKARFDSGEDVALEAVTMNPHTVAGLLKQFFRELPEPLCTFELFDAYLETQRMLVVVCCFSVFFFLFFLDQLYFPLLFRQTPLTLAS